MEDVIIGGSWVWEKVWFSCVLKCAGELGEWRKAISGHKERLMPRPGVGMKCLRSEGK